ncbi:uridine kinase family protein [Corynebacterium sp. S7]
MSLNPGPGEPYLGPFGAISLPDLLEGNPRVILIDGRGGAGKTTVARKIASLIDDSTVLHTDDIAWHYSLFDWDDVLIQHVLEPFLAGQEVNYRPPGWVAKGREGSVHIPAHTTCLIVEGSGSVRESLLKFSDLSVWIQGDYEEQRDRAIERDVATGVNGSRAEAIRFWEEWQVEEVAFFQATKPWELADIVAERLEGDTLWGV